MGITEIPFVVKKENYLVSCHKRRTNNTLSIFFCISIRSTIQNCNCPKTNGKWGGIDTQGNTVIPFEYDVANDVFVNGKMLS